MSNLLQGSTSSKSQNQIKEIKILPFRLAPAESEYADELETDTLNDLINTRKY